VISAVRDPVYAIRKGVEELIDVGISDKRLLLDEREFFQALAVLKSRNARKRSAEIRPSQPITELAG
jgi:hypothetical protein